MKADDVQEAPKETLSQAVQLLALLPAGRVPRDKAAVQPRLSRLSWHVLGMKQLGTRQSQPLQLALVLVWQLFVDAQTCGWESNSDPASVLGVQSPPEREPMDPQQLGLYRRLWWEKKEYPTDSLRRADELLILAQLSTAAAPLLRAFHHPIIHAMSNKSVQQVSSHRTPRLHSQ